MADGSVRISHPMRDMIQQIALTSGARVYSLAIGIVTLTITARWIGPEGRGAVATVTTWVNMFCTVGYLSLGQVALHRATTKRGEPWLPSTLGTLLAIDAIVTVVGLAIAAGLFFFTGGKFFNGLTPVVLAAGFVALPLVIWEQYGSALLTAVNRIDIYNQAQIVGRTVGVLLTLGAWGLGLGVVSVLITGFVSQLVIAAGGARYLIGQCEAPVRPDWATARDLIHGGLRLHLSYVGGFFITSSSVLVIAHYLGPAENGQYQLAQQLLGVLFVIPQASSLVIAGRVSQMGPERAWLFQRKLVLFVMLGMLLIAAVAAVLAPWVIPYVLGDKFRPAVGIFQALLLVVPGMTFATAMAPQWVGRGLFGAMSVLTLLFGVLNVAASVILVPRVGVFGAVWAGVGSYASAGVIQLVMFVKWEIEFRRSRASFSTPPG